MNENQREQFKEALRQNSRLHFTQYSKESGIPISTLFDYFNSKIKQHYFFTIIPRKFSDNQILTPTAIKQIEEYPILQQKIHLRNLQNSEYRQTIKTLQKRVKQLETYLLNLKRATHHLTIPQILNKKRWWKTTMSAISQPDKATKAVLTLQTSRPGGSGLERSESDLQGAERSECKDHDPALPLDLFPFPTCQLVDCDVCGQPFPLTQALIIKATRTYVCLKCY